MTDSRASRRQARRKTGGRQMGTPNRITGELREMVLTALSDLGGVDYLIHVGHERPEVFARLLARCMPQAVEARSEYDDMPVVTFNFAGRPINGSVDETESTPADPPALNRSRSS